MNLYDMANLYIYDSGFKLLTVEITRAFHTLLAAVSST